VILTINRSFFVVFDAKLALIAIKNWNRIILLILIEKYFEEDDVYRLTTIERKYIAHHFYAKF